MSRTRPSEMRTSQKRMSIGEFQWDPVLSTASRYRKRQALGGFPTAENFLKLVAFKYLQTTNPSKLEDSTSGFAYYLEKVRNVVIMDVTQKLESLWVTVECSSLRILEDLWNDYCCEYLSGLAQNTLVSKDILEELGLTNVKLRTTISEEEYRDCRTRFLGSLGEYDNLFHLYTSQITLLFQLLWRQRGRVV